MKKLLLILICLPFIGLGQTDWPAVMKANAAQNMARNTLNAANRAANAANASNRAASAKAQDEEMKNNSTVIDVDLLINNSDKYTTVVFGNSNITGQSKRQNMKNFKKILATLETSNTMQVIGLFHLKSSRDTQLKDILPNQTLYLQWHREALSSYSRVTTLTLKDSKEKIIYQATYKNLAYSEMLKPLLIDYVFTKEMALARMKEVKEFLDLGIISQQEFDETREELKPIILGK
tara:strand:- start:187 stop:891 length:705 start_codon:yes stop_codon:yes gene_type:complete